MKKWLRALPALLLAGLPHAGAAAAPAARSAPLRAVAPRGPLSPVEQETIKLFRNAKESVVYITTLVYQRDYWSLNVMEIPQGTGSGFLWDEQGHIVTNFHVIRGADLAEITLSDGSKHEARLIGVAPEKDLAVLKIDAPGRKLKALPLGTSRDLVVGQNAYAIGNPFGLDQTLTTGIISALDREIQSLAQRPIEGVIQTDAAINPGNSGGPLLDSAGRLIGVNTMIYSPSGSNAGIGFAVPVDTVNRFVPQIIRFGKPIRPGIGVQVVDARRVGRLGALIASVERAGPAAKAGLRGTSVDRYGRLLSLGDLIVEVEGRKIDGTDDLFRAIDPLEVGSPVRLIVERDGERKEFRLILKEMK